MQRLSVALSVVLLSCIACPFDNPYEKYGESCSSDAECGENLGLVCGVDGTCRGKPCANDQACKDLNANLLCLAGRCVPEGVQDAGPSDTTGDDAASADARSSDAIISTPDVYVGDLWIPDLRQFADSANTDQAPRPDASTADSVISDAPAPENTPIDDAAMPTEAGPPEAGGAPDIVPACSFDQRLMPDGSCSPLVCTASIGCSTGYICIEPPQGGPGICAPALCSNDPDCGSPMLFCDTTQSHCKPRRGGEYNGCLVEPGGQSWCDNELVCRAMGPQGLGVCLRQCDAGNTCTTDYRCLHAGDDGALGSSQPGICLAKCDANLILPATPMPFDLPLFCSNGGGNNDPGLRYAMSSNFFGIECSDTLACPGGPFVCLDFAGTSTGQCYIIAEALMWQAAGLGHIVPVKNATTFSKPLCPAGMYPAQDTSSTWLCVPQCRIDQDCKGVSPDGWQDQCVDINTANGLGHCSTDTNANSQCWLQGHMTEANSPCKRDTSQADEDSDGWPDAIDLCPAESGLGNGCPGPGMCRVNSECLSGSFCIAGECKTATDFCIPSAQSCPGGQIDRGPISPCQSSESLCAPDSPFGYPNGFCVTGASCSGSDICVANQCQPEQNPGGFYGAVPPPPELIACQSSLDCPRGGSCYVDENRCEPMYKGPPPSCVTSSECPNSASDLCVAGVCVPRLQGPQCPTGQVSITVDSNTYCLDCFQIDQPNPPWSPGFVITGDCPCQMVKDPNGTCYRDVSKTLCPGGDVGLCPAGEFDCIGEHCVPQVYPAPAVCGLGSDLVGDHCVSCFDAAGPVQSWNLPCYASDDPLCPCGLSCLPDAEGNGTCIAMGDDVECMDDPPLGSPCEKDGVVFAGSCRSSTLNSCDGTIPCSGTEVCVKFLDGAFCVPLLPNCSGVDQPCKLGEQAGVCLAGLSGATDNRCLPLRLLFDAYSDLQVSACSTDFESCGPNCVCAPDGGSGPMATGIRPQACPAGQWGVGNAPCQSFSSLPVVTGASVGAPCSAGVLPGWVIDDNGTKRCKPSGQAPSPGCGFGATQSCAADQTCQLGQCLSSSSCTDTSFESITLPDGTSSCRIKAQAAAAACGEYSQFCDIMDIAQDGVCVETSDPSNGMCYPRVGCQLTLDGETCIDGAPVPLSALDFEPRCSPWSNLECTLVAGGCSYGRCRPVDGAGGLCLNDASCHHWLECGPGQICQNQACADYEVEQDIAAGILCSVIPYRYGLDAVVYGQSSIPKTCYLLDDPRCAGKARGASCSSLYTDDPMNTYMPDPGICTSQGACVNSSDLQPGGCVANNEGQSCSFGSVSGVCVKTRQMDAWNCVP